MNPEIQIIQLSTHNRSQVKAFLALPFRIYQNIPQWVPPLEFDAKSILNRNRHPYFKHSEAAFFLALLPDKQDPIGRIAVLNNRNYNDFNKEEAAFFYLFECVDHAEAAHALFEAAYTWAKQRGLKVIIGPKGFTVLDGLGLLVKGYEHRPAFGQPYHPPYYRQLIEAEGFQPNREVVSGYLDKNMVFPEKIHQISALIQKRRGLRVMNFKSRRELMAFVPKIKDLYNGALRGTGGNAPLTDDDAKGMANQILWFADPRLIKFIMKDDEPVGFLFAYPDISAALQRTGGKLLPFGWFELLREFKRTKWVNLNGAGILEQYRGLGGTAILFSEIYKSLADTSQFEYGDLVQIGMENDKMQREICDLGINFYKMHMVYQRTL
jgi:hypothetical protein